MQILIVDDSLVMVARIFDSLACVKNIDAIYYAKAYKEAESFFGRLIPDVLLLDINLSLTSDGNTGIDLLRYMKLNNYPTKVVVVTNESNSYYRALCMELGADYFVDKSMEFDYIPGIIARL